MLQHVLATFRTQKVSSYQLEFNGEAHMLAVRLETPSGKVIQANEYRGSRVKELRVWLGERSMLAVQLETPSGAWDLRRC